MTSPSCSHQYRVLLSFWVPVLQIPLCQSPRFSAFSGSLPGRVQSFLSASQHENRPHVRAHLILPLHLQEPLSFTALDIRYLKIILVL